MDRLYRSPNPQAEQAMLDEISIDAPWALIERFSTLVRESGSEDERTAARYISDRLSEWGVPHEMHEPTLFLSIPRNASVEASGRTLRAKTPSMSRPTGPGGLTGELVYVPSSFARNAAVLFDSLARSDIDVRGKIVVSEGMGMPGAVTEFERRGAIGQIYINPGQDIHWGICTTVWGAPDLDTLPRLPTSIVAAVNRPDGEWLKEQAQQGNVQVTVRTELTEGWMPCLLPVVEIKGTVEPDKFIFVHGHYDSWDVGIGDNAVGDGTLLELARIFWKHRDQLQRTVRIAWWPGHSTGRYGGSTWYADTWAMDLAENCIAEVNIDSPGCRWATEYINLTCMTEAVDLCQTAIRDATGQDSEMERPHQAGDYSFNNIGITSFYMLLSTMPPELAEEKGYYVVGGCGGNIAWHTENDTLEIADKDNLLRDLRVYIASITRVANAPVLPFNFVRLADEFTTTLQQYRDAAKGRFDFDPALAEVGGLRNDLEQLYRRIEQLSKAQVGEAETARINQTLMQLARVLVPINFTRHGHFRNEPAVSIPALPDLAPAADLGKTDPDSDDARVLVTHLTRGRNRVVGAMRMARQMVQATLQAPPPVEAAGMKR
jgi:N-acetylated-alpha-linked acidic dipeptidase